VLGRKGTSPEGIPADPLEPLHEAALDELAESPLD